MQINNKLIPIVNNFRIEMFQRKLAELNKSKKNMYLQILK